MTAPGDQRHEQEDDSAPTADNGSVEAEPASPGGTRQANDDSADGGKGVGLLQLIGSAFAAGLGVQSSRNRERDFKQGRAGAFILTGLVFTALFIATVYGIVSLVLSTR